MNHTQLAKARQLAVRQSRGEILTVAQKQFIAYWVDELSPENFYMDGELFASA